MITAEAPQPQMVAPTPEEIAEAMASMSRTSTVYESNANHNPEAIRIEEVEQRVGSLATGQAVGMASLPEQYADQQLHKFNFTAQEYAAHQAYQADAIRQLEESLKKTTESEEDEESPN